MDRNVLEINRCIIGPIEYGAASIPIRKRGRQNRRHGGARALIASAPRSAEPHQTYESDSVDPYQETRSG